MCKKLKGDWPEWKWRELERIATTLDARIDGERTEQQKQDEECKLHHLAGDCPNCGAE